MASTPGFNAADLLASSFLLLILWLALARAATRNNPRARRTAYTAVVVLWLTVQALVFAGTWAVVSR